jgi:four helix bundle protein
MPPYDIRERTFEFAKTVVHLCVDLDSQGGTLRRLSGQLFDSGTSVGAMLQESRGGQTRKDSTAKCYIALKEARETLYWLQLLAACFPTRTQSVRPLIGEADQLVAILTTIAKRAKGKSQRDS